MKKSLTYALCTLSLTTLIYGCVSDSPQAVTGSQQQTHQRYYVVADSLNLRECAGTECRIISVLKRGDHGVVIKQQNPWVQIQLQSKNYTGWVSGRYLSPNYVEKKPPAPQRESGPQTPPKMPKKSLTKPVLPPPVLEEELAVPEPGAAGIPPEISETLASPASTENVVPPAALEEELAE